MKSGGGDARFCPGLLVEIEERIDTANVLGDIINSTLFCLPK